MAICFKRLCAILQITSLSHSLVTPTFLIIKSEDFHLLIMRGIVCYTCAQVSCRSPMVPKRALNLHTPCSWDPAQIQHQTFLLWVLLFLAGPQTQQEVKTPRALLQRKFMDEHKGLPT